MAGAEPVSGYQSRAAGPGRGDQVSRITSIAIPPLGSGLGGLYWPDVRALIEEAFHELDGVRVLVFEPAEDPNAVRCNNHTRDVPNMTAGRAPPVEQMRTSVKS